MARKRIFDRLPISSAAPEGIVVAPTFLYQTIDGRGGCFSERG